MQGRKPTRAEWKIFERRGLDSRDYLVQKATNTYLQVVNKATGKELTIRVDMSEV